MKFCQKCGKEIMEEAVICPGCGCAVGESKVNTVNSNAETEVKESSSTANCALIFAFLMPIVGIIFGIIGACKYKNSSYKSKSIISIVLSVVMWIVWAIILTNL